MAAKSHRSNQSQKAKITNKNKKNDTNMLWEVLTVIIPAIVLFWVIHTFIAEARFVPSESMVPTIEIGDRFLVEKVSYYLGPPKRGDIVVFQPTDEAKRLASQHFVKL
ncbi:MAG TPA: signal peptidase I, partial [Bacillota bacterium]|nr:signal peptidase I [Bacillota bacterium]